ncbi:ABC transporter permease subunit [Mesorhizobium sp. M0047]|uniref:ABC transporter permease n=1 Tax=Mesorhizobium sp. M0047 TaxID=2956859 RepID=UPI00333540F6
MDVPFLTDTFLALVSGVPLTIQLTVLSLAAGALLAAGLVAMQLSRFPLLALIAKTYVFVFRGSPLLVQIYLIYFGLGQFPALRASLLWPFLREPYWCALLALALNEAAYSSEIMRGALRSVPSGHIEAGKACGMSSFLLLRRIVVPTALRNSLPACANEMIVMVKATALVSTITLLDITGIAAQIVSDTYRSIEVFLMAGAIYLAINFAITNAVSFVEYKLNHHLREA